MLTKTFQYFQKLFHVTDVILYGRMLYCTKCMRGSFVFNNWVYKCHGYLSAWANCDNIVREPRRRPAFIPESLRMAHDFLQRDFGFRMRLLEYSPSIDTVQIQNNENDFWRTKSKPKKHIVKGLYLPD